MRISGKIAISGVALGLVLGTGGVASAEPRMGADGAGFGAAGGFRSVTLMTGGQGDRFRLGGAGDPAGAGRERVGFSAFKQGDHLYVVPADASRLLASGRLDRRLFDVTLQLEFGYDDASRATLPLIVSAADGATPATFAGATVTAALSSIHACAVSVDKTATADVWRAVTGPGVEKVWLDGQRRASLDRSVPQVGAPAASAAGYTGLGVKVAVLDTGVDQTIIRAYKLEVCCR